MRLDIYLHDSDADEDLDEIVKLLKSIDATLTKLYTEFHFLHQATQAIITPGTPVEQ